MHDGNARSGIGAGPEETGVRAAVERSEDRLTRRRQLGCSISRDPRHRRIVRQSRRARNVASTLMARKLGTSNLEAHAPNFFPRRRPTPARHRAAIFCRRPWAFVFSVLSNRIHNAGEQRPILQSRTRSPTDPLKPRALFCPSAALLYFVSLGDPTATLPSDVRTRATVTTVRASRIRCSPVT